jgi:hypothetical protein
MDSSRSLGVLQSPALMHQLGRRAEPRLFITTDCCGDPARRSRPCVRLISHPSPVLPGLASYYSSYTFQVRATEGRDIPCGCPTLWPSAQLCPPLSLISLVSRWPCGSYIARLPERASRFDVDRRRRLAPVRSLPSTLIQIRTHCGTAKRNTAGGIQEALYQAEIVIGLPLLY